MQQADDVSSYAREDRPRIHGVRSLMSYSSKIKIKINLSRSASLNSPRPLSLRHCSSLRTDYGSFTKFSHERVTSLSALR